MQIVLAFICDVNIELVRGRPNECVYVCVCVCVCVGGG